MPDYTLKNFMEDIEDSAAGHGLGDRLQSRFARRQLDCRHLGVSLFSYSAGFRTPFGHHHREQEEVYVVIAGSGRVRLDDEVRDLRQWDALRVAPEVVRAFEGGPDGLELIAIGADRPAEGDGEMVPDFWTD